MAAAQYVADCPRCGVCQVTFDWAGQNLLNQYESHSRLQLEAFCVCRACHDSTVFKLEVDDFVFSKIIREEGFGKINGDVTGMFNYRGYVSIADFDTEEAPEHLPSDVEKAFEEGARCHTIGCPNAAGSMLRLCLDLASKELLTKVPPSAPLQPNNHQKSNLAPRLDFLIDNGYLPNALHDLVHCIRDDGNVAAHQGEVTNDEAQEMMDLTLQVLTRVYTEPCNLAAIKARQAARKAAKP